MVGLAVTLGIVGPGAAAGAATPGVVITEFPGSSIRPFAPLKVTTGPDGAVWFTEGINRSVGRITTAGQVTRFVFPETGFIYDITTGPDGNLWFTDQRGDNIGRMSTGGQLTLFHIAGHSDDFGNGPHPTGITGGPDGNVWFTEQQGNRIGRITPSGQVTEFALPTDPLASPDDLPGVLFPVGITAGPDGNLWFTESRFGAGPHVGNRIGRITPSGVITDFPIPTLDAFPQWITPGPDGNLWFTEPGADSLDPEDFPQVDNVARVTTSGVITEFPVMPGSRPTDVTAGADGNIWFTEIAVNRVGRISTDGSLIGEYPTPTSPSAPNGITHGPDGRVWFAETQAGQMARTQVVGCTQTQRGKVSGPLTITSGSLCLTNAAVTGPVTVGPQASLFVTGSQITGGITADGAGLVRLCSSQLRSGGVTASGTTDVIEIGNPAQGCGPNQIDGAVNLNNNSSPTAVLAGNQILGNLSCSANNPAPVNAGIRNLVRGTRSGQCAAL